MMLTCRDISELVTDYLEGNLSTVNWLRFQLHLGMCHGCRAYLAQMRATARAVGQLPNDPVPPEIKSELLARFRSQPHHRPSVVERVVAKITSLVGRGPGAIAGAFALALIALLVVGVHHGPVGNDAMCISMELALGLLPVGFLAALVRSTPTRFSPGTAATVALVSALPAYFILFFVCPLSHSLPHLLVYHLGGLVAVLGGGFMTPRLFSTR